MPSRTVGKTTEPRIVAFLRGVRYPNDKGVGDTLENLFGAGGVLWKEWFFFITGSKQSNDFKGSLNELYPYKEDKK